MTRYSRTSIFSRSAISRALLSGRTLKPMMMAFAVDASMTSVSVIAPTPPWIVRTRTSSLDSFSSDWRTASTEPCTSALMIRFRSLIWPAEIWLNRSSSVVFCWSLISARRSLSLRSSATWRESLSSSTALMMSPASGTSLKPMTSTGCDGPASFTRPAAVVDHGAHAAVCRSGDDRVADAQRAVLDQHGRHRAAALVQPRSMMMPAFAVRVGAVVPATSATSRIISSSWLIAPAGHGGDGHQRGRVAAPLLADELVLGQLLLDALDVRADLVDLVDGDDDLDARRLGVADGLDGLRHDAVVRGDHEHGDVRRLRAAHTHGRERLVARPRKVIWRPSRSTVYAPMCCVMPPASVEVTCALRM